MTFSIKALCLARGAKTVVLAASLGIFAHGLMAQQANQQVLRHGGQQVTGTVAEFARTPGGSQQAGSATCTPAGSRICKGFTGGCNAVGGGLSSSPDGGVTCSVASRKSARLKTSLTARAVKIRRGGGASGEVSTCESDGTRDGNTICDAFGQSCGDVGCGPSTNPNGTVSCACQ